MKSSCLECKYYDYEQGRFYCNCIMNQKLKKPNDCCDYFVAVGGTKQEGRSDKIDELERRVDHLEKLILKLL